MIVDERIKKAKQLKTENRVEEIIELLEDWVNENSDNSELIALYYTSKAIDFFNKNKINADQLYGESKKTYQSFPVDFALQLSYFRFLYNVSAEYLDNSEDKWNRVYLYLQSEIDSLEKMIYPYDIFKKQIESFCAIMSKFDVREATYYILSQFIDWKSVISDNMVQFFVDKAKPVVEKHQSSDEDVYNAYTAKMQADDIPAFIDRPKLSGGYPPIVSKKIKDFWVGYYNLVASTAVKELAVYNQIQNDKNHQFYSATNAWTYMYNRLSECKNEMPEDEYWQRFKIVQSIYIQERNFIDKIKDAQKLAGSIKVSLVAQIKGLFKKG
ncbi:MAG: hypothetical protein IJ999_02330 [Clostridia bacterium]|nr:hypothetical protein [Clostridia bacterium]